MRRSSRPLKIKPRAPLSCRQVPIPIRTSNRTDWLREKNKSRENFIATIRPAIITLTPVTARIRLLKKCLSSNEARSVRSGLTYKNMSLSVSQKRLSVISLCLLGLAIAGLKFGLATEAGSGSTTATEGLAKSYVYSVDPAVKVAREVLADTAEGQRTPVVIFLTDQADVSSAYQMKDQDARGWYVYNTLTKHAERTQAPIKAMLDAEGVQYQSFWAANRLV